MGNHDVELKTRGGQVKKCSIYNFPRKRKSAWQLLYLALDNFFWRSREMKVSFFGRELKDPFVRYIAFVDVIIAGIVFTVLDIVCVCINMMFRKLICMCKNVVSQPNTEVRVNRASISYTHKDT